MTRSTRSPTFHMYCRGNVEHYSYGFSMYVNPLAFDRLFQNKKTHSKRFGESLFCVSSSKAIEFEKLETKRQFEVISSASVCFLRIAHAVFDTGRLPGVQCVRVQSWAGFDADCGCAGDGRWNPGQAHT